MDVDGVAFVSGRALGVVLGEQVSFVIVNANVEGSKDDGDDQTRCCDVEFFRVSLDLNGDGFPLFFLDGKEGFVGPIFF